MINKISVLHITVRADIGGGPEHVFRLITCNYINVNHFVAAPNNEPYFGKFKDAIGDAKCIEIPFRKFEINVLFKLFRFVRRNNISIIHSHGKGAGIYGRLLSLLTGKRAIHTLHGFHIGDYNKIQKYLYISLERILSIFTYKIIAVSEGEKNKIVKSGFCNQKKVVVIPNGVIIPKEKVRQSDFSQKPKKVISFSRFNYQKNTEMIVDICKLLKNISIANDFEFLIYGDGEDFGKIKKLISEENLDKIIKLAGPDPDARNKLVDGFCYISTSRWEGLPISLLEAMAVGLPVIATNVVGNRDIIENYKDGFLFDSDNINEAASLLSELADSEDLWKKISSGAIKKVEENFSINKMITKIEELYLS